jgi:alcohol dehydrogenase YqhD (iron-dependent ADH family)
VQFRYHNPTVLYFGGEYLREKLAEEVTRYGNEVLLVYGQGSAGRNGLYEEVVDILSQAGVTVHVLGGVRPNAHLQSVYEGIAMCRQHPVTLVLALGGGSVMDTAKAVAAGALYEGDVWDFFAGTDAIPGALPVGTIVTTAGTGSEMNPFAVVSNPATHDKRLVASPHLYPSFSFCVPEVTKAIPQRQTAFGVVDMFTHVLETYLTAPSTCVLQRRFQEALLKTVVEYGRKVVQHPDDLHVRETLMHCSTLALNGMTSMGLIGDWSTHTIADALGGYCDVPHGALLAVLLPHWMEYVLQEGVDPLYYLAVHVFGLDASAGSKLDVARMGIASVRQFFAEIGAPQSLGELGIGSSHFEQVADRIASAGSIGKIRPLYRSDVIQILEQSV